MATKQELEAQLAKLQAELRTVGEQLREAGSTDLNSPEFDRLAAERTRLRAQVSEVGRQLDRILLGEATSFVARIDDQTGLVEIRTSDGLFAGRGNTLAEAKDRAIRSGANASALENLIDPQAKAAADQGSGAVSAGDTTAQAQTARDDGAMTQNPPQPVTVEGRVTGNVTNAEGFQVNSDTGTNAAPRPVTETNSVPPSTAATPVSQSAELQRAQGGAAPGSAAIPQQSSNQPRPNTANSAGQGAREDAGTAGESNPVQVLANRTVRNVTPQANILDQYSSYTYSISIYLMSPEDYRRLMSSQQRYIPGYLLLMQSAGAPTASDIQATPGVADVGEVPGGPSLTQGRNQFFPLDYYIDDLELTSVIPGKGTGMPHSVTELKFRITEPNGITLLPNLFRAANQYVTQGSGNSQVSATGDANYAAQNYLMVIRFYGYDQQGNLLTQPASVDGPSRTDANAILEKFIPFQFTDIKFTIANRLTEYQCQAVAPQNNINTGQGRGTIPYNMQLTATTLQNLFNGNVAFEQQRDTPQARDENTRGDTQSPDKATAAPDPTLATGLTQALNNFQKQLVARREVTVADEYEIRISHPEIANSRVVPPGTNDRSTRPNVQANSASQAKDSDKQAVQNNAKTVSVTAGTSILQFIDLAVRSSTYIIDQQTKIVTRDRTGREVQIRQGGTAQAMVWYTIGIQATPIGDAQDPLRGDYAYRITYEISPYAINQMKSDYFPNGQFRGVQKRYPYWFTGENTSVLSYEQEFNHLYYLTINSGQAPTFRSGDYREIEKRISAPNSSETNQGQRGNPFEPGANAADFLYSPSDLGRVKMTIVGDPAWIAQGEVWHGVRSLRNAASQPEDQVDPYVDPFLPDGTINFDARECLFEVAFNQPADYDIMTGVMQVQKAR